MKRYTMKDFDKEFPNDDACLEWIKNHRWPDGIHCPKCQKVTKHHRVKNRSCYECDYCGNQVYPTADTIFHKSATSLRTWFQAIYQMASTRCGISAKQIQRETGVTYKTAWRMFKQIRTLLNENPQLLFGEVEADETYIGGRRGRGAEGKTPVIGIAQRKRQLMASTISDVKQSTIVPFITRRVSPEATLYTDEYPIYDRMAQFGYDHKRIEHEARIYVRGSVHTNNIEGFWSLLKRGISGAYHAVSPKYLQFYLDEYSFRYNHRADDKPMFETFLSQI